MSIIASSDDLDTLSTLLTVNQIGVGVITLISFEYIITFSEEVALFWKRKKSGATWLFFVTRYLSVLAYAILPGIQLASGIDDDVRGFSFVDPPLELTRLSYRVFSSLRTAAISQLNWWFTISVLVLASVPFGLELWAISYAANLMVLGVTWWYTTISSTSAYACGVQSSLRKVLVINGCVYFLMLLCLPAAQLAFVFASNINAVPHVDSLSNFIGFADPFTAILICRFMLALQAANKRVMMGHGMSDSRAADPDDNYDDVAAIRFAHQAVMSMRGPVDVDSALYSSHDSRWTESCTDATDYMELSEVRRRRLLVGSV
ncbi:hypothetical protein C2E23DRAFT_886206 [Lenzites betulinus]|nr:hypothetical protein C2E23DRAFT_886206 [Lenzites betulinus]